MCLTRKLFDHFMIGYYESVKGGSSLRLDNLKLSKNYDPSEDTLIQLNKLPEIIMYALGSFVPYFFINSTSNKLY